MSARVRFNRPSRFLAVLVALHLAAMAAAWVLLRFWSDAWWPATLLLFGPRWIHALPFLLTVPAALVLDRRLLGPIAVTAAILVGPIMDFRLPLKSAFAGGAGPSRLRVMTYNIGGNKSLDSQAIERLVERVAPDIAAFQECGNRIDAKKLEQKGWHAHVSTYQCLLSRHPIRAVDLRDPRDMWEVNGAGNIARYEIDTPLGPVNFANLHLETVRDGLSALIGKRLAGVPELEANIAQRTLESKIARAWVERGSAPTIVAGDFNMPVESSIYDRYWSDFHNAFSEAGLGFGTSKATNWHGIRIDHVLFDPTWVCKTAYVAEDLGGDHRPMVAELERASASL